MTHASKTDPIERAEQAGRKGDRLLGHLTPGDVVIPKGKVTPELREFLAQHFDVDRYTAGHEKNSTNPKTGLPEFYDSFGGGMDVGGEPGAPGAMGQEGFAGGYTDAGTGGGASGPQAPAQSPGFWDAIKGFFSSGVGPAPVADSHFGNVNSAQGSGANGGVLDSTMPSWLLRDAGLNPYGNGSQQMATPVVPNNVNPLVAPQAPNVPDSAPDLGRYYGALINQDMTLANNLLGPYLSGNKNVYGR